MSKIMLVEDDNNLREIYEARLLAEGYEIVSAKDGEEALAMAVKEKPDLIISDVMMPKISGFDMLDILRSTPETKNTKVIMMTALSQAEDKARADKLGADRYLVKSQVTLEDVAKVARDVLAGDETGAGPDPTTFSQPPITAPDTSTPVAVSPEPPVSAPEPPASVDPTPTPVAAQEPQDLPVSVAAPAAPEPSEPQNTTAAEVATPPITTPQPDLTTANLGQTTASEEAAIDAQINDFVSKIEPTEDEAPAPATDSAPDVPLVTLTDTSEPQTDSGAVSSTETDLAQPPSQTELASQNAENLAESANEILQQPSPEETPENSNVTINNKKIISPTGNMMSTGPDLNALLAQEKEAEAIRPIVESVANPGATVPAPGSTIKDDKSPVQNPGAGNMVMPNSADDPNNIAL